MAEREGFEPSIQDYCIHTFQACALDHSATFPGSHYYSCEFLYSLVVKMLLILRSDFINVYLVCSTNYVFIENIKDLSLVDISNNIKFFCIMMFTDYMSVESRVFL